MPMLCARVCVLGSQIMFAQNMYIIVVTYGYPCMCGVVDMLGECGLCWGI